LIFLGYLPEKEDIPHKIIDKIGFQLKIKPDVFNEYEWKSRTWHHHIALIRSHYGFRACENSDFNSLLEWLISQNNTTNSQNNLLNLAIEKFRNLRIELPSEKELQRIVNSSRQKFLENLYKIVSEKINPITKKLMDFMIDSSEGEISCYDWIKTKPGALKIKTILDEINKLNFIKEFNIDSQYLKGFSQEIIYQLKERVMPEDSYQIKRHPEPIRYTLIAVLLHFQQMEVTDNIVRCFLELIRRIEKKSDTSLEKDLINNIKKVYGKNKILYKLALASTANPNGRIQDVIFKEVKEEVLKRIVEEYESGNQEVDYNKARTKVMKTKYNFHYRQMLKPVFDTLVFKANNPAHKPIILGLNIIKKYLDTKHIYYPDEEKIPEGIITGHWNDIIYDDTKNNCRIIKYYFEICVLQKLEKALKCKEIWVEGAYFYRNPDTDLPQDWNDRRIEYCNKFKIPEKAEDFIEPIRKEMTKILNDTNDFFAKKQDNDVYIYYPGGGEKGLFRIPKIEARPERPILKDIKSEIIKQWGMIDLMDVLVEADRQVNILKFFHTTGQRQILKQEDARERLMLSLFGIGTNLGLRRIHSAVKPSFSYDDLLYFLRRFVKVDPVREAIAALTKRILQIRNPKIWGVCTSCASDAKHIGAWNQNLVAEWNPHYQKKAIMAYWHVDKNSTCIFSQLKTPLSSEVATMIKGLILHDTEMRIDKNFVDSHGQSEVAFPFCRFIFVELCPRLKRLKYERIYLSEKNMESKLIHLKGVLGRPILWDKIYDQYGEMARHVVAVLERTGPIESILRRFNTNNRNHPTYKAFIEVGKALKTTHICKVLTRQNFREEIHDALNIVENWNSVNSFICYGRKSEIQTNDPNMQELIILCIHLLQNALILVNTILIERVILTNGFFNKMQPEDFYSLTPLFTTNINPYGYFSLNFEKPSIIGIS
ncbi:MAG: Tn3 family transposase, partial [Desulfobacterales bacterium]|nr:Tn3 family transposase [Desulfobacterales bacterium]